MSKICIHGMSNMSLEQKTNHKSKQHPFFTSGPELNINTENNLTYEIDNLVTKLENLNTKLLSIERLTERAHKVLNTRLRRIDDKIKRRKVGERLSRLQKKSEQQKTVEVEIEKTKKRLRDLLHDKKKRAIFRVGEIVGAFEENKRKKLNIKNRALEKIKTYVDVVNKLDEIITELENSQEEIDESQLEADKKSELE